MKVHTNLKELLADFSIYRHRWLLTKDDKRTFTELTDDYLSANSLALGKPEPLAKNKQTQFICPECESLTDIKNFNETRARCINCGYDWAIKADATSR